VGLKLPTLLKVPETPPVAVTTPGKTWLFWGVKPFRRMGANLPLRLAVPGVPVTAILSKLLGEAISAEKVLLAVCV
jgi:hypothetical protein